jgi:hypothetical protein
MKMRFSMLFLGIFIPLLFLQLSCATGQKAQSESSSKVITEQVKPVEEAPAKITQEAPVKPAQETPVEAIKTPAVETTPAVALLLADKHKAAGVECADCHKETPPATEAPTAVCMTCHADYKDKASSSIDPHNAHMTYERCGDCHHGHKESENQCMSCHSFSLKTP